MISKLGRKIFWLKVLPQWWAFLPLLVLLQLSILTSEVGSFNTASYGDGSNSNGYSSLCRVVRDTRKHLLLSFKEQYTASSFHCDLTNHCANVTCSAEFSRSVLRAGMELRLCDPQDEPKVDYWVETGGLSWLHTFSSKGLNGQSERAEIIGNHTGSVKETKSTRWFIKVTFSITNGRLQINNSSKHISIQSVLQICENEIENSCTKNTTLLSFPRIPIRQICYFDDDESSPNEDDGGSSLGSSSRSSRNANAWNPQKLHLMAAERAKKFENGRPLPPSPGDICDSENVFGCGPGATCVVNSDGDGTCHCLSGFSVNTSSGLCVPALPSPSPTDSTEDNNNRSYSSAIGAIISISILVLVAAILFFAAKYNYFSRFRHRIPVIRWPFRRRERPWEDINVMVDNDDDPPLL